MLRSYQPEERIRLLQIHCSGQKLSSMLLIQCTGCGKSTVPQTVGVVTCGVTLVWENTLSLGADQQSKFKNTVQENSSVNAFQLDLVTSTEDIQI